jgi:trigger factor
MKREMRTQAEREIKNTFVVEAIAEAEGIAVSPEELESEIRRRSVMMRDAARARREFADPDRRERVEGSLRRNKTIQWLVENATQEDEPSEAAALEAVPADETPAADTAGTPEAQPADTETQANSETNQA